MKVVNRPVSVAVHPKLYQKVTELQSQLGVSMRGELFNAAITKLLSRLDNGEEVEPISVPHQSNGKLVHLGAAVDPALMARLNVLANGSRDGGGQAGLLRRALLDFANELLPKEKSPKENPVKAPPKVGGVDYLFCPHCGHRLQPGTEAFIKLDYRFCPYCGKSY